MNIDKAFKSYDIRSTEITVEFGEAVANAFAQHKKISTCIVGRDVRNNSPELSKAVIKGLRKAGVNVIDIGIVSTSQLKWVIAHHEFESAIMITASHNPAEYNGFKFYGQSGETFGKGDGLWDLKQYLEKPVEKNEGSLEEKRYMEEYVDFLIQHHPSDKRMVFIDPSGGAACKEVIKLAEKGDYNFVLYNSEEDPNFSQHPPDPLDEEATEAARTFCGMNKCIGIVLDADADRIIFVDEDGKTVPGDFFGAWFTKHFLKEGESVTATVRDSRAIKDEALKKNGKFILSAVGGVNIQRAMQQHGLSFGYEKSGHNFFREAHNSEAPLLCLLMVLEKLEGTLAEEIREYREHYIASTENNYVVTDQNAVLELAKTTYEGRGEIILIDGVLCEGPDWWVNIRASNTEPLIRLTLEAKDQETYSELKKEAEALIKPFLKE